jgi:hypothetical protein
VSGQHWLTSGAILSVSERKGGERGGARAGRLLGRERATRPGPAGQARAREREHARASSALLGQAEGEGEVARDEVFVFPFQKCE